MIVLGINEDHNATAALVKDGRVLYCASEERITRVKNDIGYPYQTIEEALQQTGITRGEIDYVVYTAEITDAISIKVKRITKFKISDYVSEMYEHWKPVLIDHAKPYFWDRILKDPRFEDPKTEYYDFGFMKTTLVEQWNDEFKKARVDVVVKQLGIAPEKVLFKYHHECHAAYAYFASPIDRSKKTAVVVADGWGDGANGSIYVGENNKITKIHSTALCNLARVYRYMTLLLGMRPFEHEYKVMGLAPYAHEYLVKPALEIFRNTLVVDGIDFKWKEKPSDLYFYFRDRLEGMRFDGIAGALQQWLDEMVVQWVKNIMEHLKVDQVVFSGGLSMNVKANKAIAEISELKDFFVPPSGGDESATIGAAYAVFQDQGIASSPFENAYFGYAITDAEVTALVTKYNLREQYEVQENIAAQNIADLLSKGKVIARCVDRMEFGARALGNRSILCDPQKYENIRLINEKIKFRDFWMPFTPSMLDYRAKDYLINPKGLHAPFMSIAFATTALGQEHLKAAIHPHDQTVRPQVLTKEANPAYYELIQAFEKKTGVGALLNTSLNLHGLPIVRNAEDAYYTLLNSGLDGLVLNTTLILKK